MTRSFFTSAFGLAVDIDDTLSETFFASQNLSPSKRDVGESPFFHANLQAVKNAAHWSQKIHRHLPIRLYLSNRPQSLKRITAKWLKTWGFPQAPLKLRPKKLAAQAGAAWKAKFLIKKHSSLAGLIDDNPAILKYLPKNYPGKIFLFRPRAKTQLRDSRAVTCRSWQEIYRQVIKFKKIWRNSALPKSAAFGKGLRRKNTAARKGS